MSDKQLTDIETEERSYTAALNTPHSEKRKTENLKLELRRLNSNSRHKDRMKQLTADAI